MFNGPPYVHIMNVEAKYVTYQQMQSYNLTFDSLSTDTDELYKDGSIE